MLDFNKSDLAEILARIQPQQWSRFFFAQILIILYSRMNHSKLEERRRQQLQSPQDDNSYGETENLHNKMNSPDRNPMKSHGNISMKRGAVSFNIGRIMPRHINHDKQFLYEENIKLKQSVQEFRQEVLKLKTRLSATEKEKERIVDEFSHSDLPTKNSSSRVYKRSSGVSYSSLQNNNYMRKMMRQAKDQITAIKNENTKLKKTVKYTEISELQVQNKYLLEECARLGNIIQSKVLNQNEYIEEYEDEIRGLKDELYNQRENNKNIVNLSNKRGQQIQELKSQVKELYLREKRLKKQLQDAKRVPNHHHNNHNANTQGKPQKLSAAAPQPKHTAKQVKPAPANGNHSKINSMETDKKIVDRQEDQNKSSIVKIDTSNSAKNGGHKNIPPQPEKAHELQEKEDSGEEEGYGDQFDQEEEKENEESGSNFEAEYEPKQSVKKEKQQKDDYQDEFDDIDDNKSEQQVLFTKKTLNKQSILKDTITLRLMSQRYTYTDLCQDIKQSEMQQFKLQQLASMLNDQPFFLSEEQIEQVLSYIFRKDDLHLDDKVKAKEFLNQIKMFIGDFEPIEQQKQQQQMQKCLQILHKNSKKLIKQLDSLQTDNTVSKKTFIKALQQYKLSPLQINLLLGEAALVSNTIEEINYRALITKLPQ